MMGAWLRAFLASGFRPFEFSPAERFCLRLLTATTIFILPEMGGDWTRASLPRPESFSLDSQPYPNGLAHLVDLSWIGHPEIYRAIYWGMALLCLPYVLGFALPLVLPLLALSHICIFTLYQSQGAIGHDNQLLSLVILGQALAVVLPRLWRWRGKVFPPCPDPRKWGDYLFNVTLQVMAAGYVVAGISKLIKSKGLWVWQTPDLVVEMVKTNDQRFYTKSDPAAGVELADTIAFMTEHPQLTRLVLGSGFFLELFAFLALRNRGWALFFGIGLLGLHRSILWLMKLGFPENEQLLFIYLINPVFWGLAGWAWLVGQRDERLRGVDQKLSS